MILCHKCSGTFENVQGLHGCRCISGYPRGFEKDLTLEQAATAQAKQSLEWLALYVSQKRDSEDSCYEEELRDLCSAMKLSPAFGHGTVNWKLLNEV